MWRLCFGLLHSFLWLLQFGFGIWKVTQISTSPHHVWLNTPTFHPPNSAQNIPWCFTETNFSQGHRLPLAAHLMFLGSAPQHTDTYTQHNKHKLNPWKKTHEEEVKKTHVKSCKYLYNDFVEVVGYKKVHPQETSTNRAWENKVRNTVNIWVIIQGENSRCRPHLLTLFHKYVTTRLPKRH